MASSGPRLAQVSASRPRRLLILAEGHSADPHFGKTARGVLRYLADHQGRRLDAVGHFQSCGKISQLHIGLRQPELRRRPLRRQFGRTCESFYGLAQAALGQEDSARPKEKRRFVHRAVRAEGRAPVFAFREQIRKLVLNRDNV